MGNDKDRRPEWQCLVCAKFLGQQGEGGSFSNAIGRQPQFWLDFGYGSSFDGGPMWEESDYKQAPHISGWVCDECVVQRHTRFKVCQRRPDHEERKWDDKNEYTSLAEHPETKRYIEPNDLPDWAVGHEAITSDERAMLQDQLFDNQELDRRLVGKLMAALSAAEVRHAKLRLERQEFQGMALERQRQNAELLTAEEITKMREREGARWSGEESITRLHESVAWYEERWHEMSDAWGDALHEVVQISDELADGHPVVRGTETRVSDVLEQLTKFSGHPELLRGMASYFDRTFMKIMMTYAERGYVRRYFEASKQRREELLEQRDSKK